MVRSRAVAKGEDTGALLERASRRERVVLRAATLVGRPGGAGSVAGVSAIVWSVELEGSYFAIKRFLAEVARDGSLLVSSLSIGVDEARAGDAVRAQVAFEEPVTTSGSRTPE